MPNVLVLTAWLTAQPLTFSQALASAETVPSVEAVRHAQQARESLADDVSAFTYNPTLQVQPGVRAPATGGAQPEIYVGLSQRFNAAGLSDARRQTLAREGAHDGALLDMMRREARLEIARAWFERWIGQAGYAAAREEITLIDQLIAGLETTLAAGESTRVDVAVMKGFRAEVALNALRIEGDTFDAGLALTRSLGKSETAPTAADGDLPTLASPPMQRLVDALGHVTQTPDVIAARAARDAQAARLTETQAARGSTYALGAMAFREGSGDVAVLATLDIDLPLFEGGERERADVAADLALADGRVRETEVMAHSERAAAVHELEHAEQVAGVAHDELLVAAESLADAQHQRWLAREATAQEWVTARRGVLQAKLTVLRAQANVTFARFVVAERFGDLVNGARP